MGAGPERPAFYAFGRGRAGDLLTLLHPPYTLWHLSYFALGAGVAPTVHADRLLWGLAAFALAVGVAAHALDELHDRPLGSALSDGALRGLAAVSLLAALAIGVGGVLSVTPWLAPLVLIGGLFLPAYNLELGERSLPQRPVVRRRLGRVPRLHRLFRQRREGGRAGAGDGAGLHGDERGTATFELAGARAASPHAGGAGHAHASRRKHRSAVTDHAAGATGRRAGGLVACNGDHSLRAAGQPALKIDQLNITRYIRAESCV